MRTTILTAIAAAALAPAAAFADAVVVYDAGLGERFETKREIVEIAKDTYGPTSVFDSGQQIPESVEQSLVAGRTLPGSVEAEPVPAALADRLPHTEDGTRWVAVGEHLLELRPDDTIVMGVYAVLPGAQ